MDRLDLLDAFFDPPSLTRLSSTLQMRAERRAMVCMSPRMPPPSPPTLSQRNCRGELGGRQSALLQPGCGVERQGRNNVFFRAAFLHAPTKISESYRLFFPYHVRFIYRNKNLLLYMSDLWRTFFFNGQTNINKQKFVSSKRSVLVKDLMINKYAASRAC